MSECADPMLHVEDCGLLWPCPSRPNRPKPCPECELLGYRTCDCMEVPDER